MSSRLGPRQGDLERFGEHAQSVLRDACKDLGFLRGRGYADDASLKIVGDRYQLDGRQRKALRGAACSQAQRVARLSRSVGLEGLRDRRLEIDAYNLLIVLESARAHGVVIRGMDGCLRDLAGLHGAWRASQETTALLQTMGVFFARNKVRSVAWWVDAPVSKSGGFGRFLEDTGAEWGWEAHVVMDPDNALIQEKDNVVVSSDAYILDHCAQWCNVAGLVVSEFQWDAPIVDLECS